MNNFFKAVDSLFESGNDIVLDVAGKTKLNERGSKYLQPDPDNKYNNIDDRGISKPKRMDDYDYRNGRLLKPGFERYLYDVVKHLNPAGYVINFSGDYSKGTYIIGLKGGESNNNYKIGELNISINDNDEVVVSATPNTNKYDRLPDIFGQKATMKEIGQQLAREKGANYDEDFVIDNGAEIRDRFNNQKSEGTVDELVAKIEKQIKKLPSNKLIGYTESAEVTSKGSKLDEAFSDSCPNWLKMTLKKQNDNRNADYYPALFSADTEFTPVPTDKIKGKNGLTTLSKEALANGEEVFIRTKYGVLGFYDNKWRSITNRDRFFSSEEVGDSIIAAVKTTNKQATRDDMSALRNNRKDAKDGSVERKKDLDKWDIEDRYYDKSGYRLNPTKYQDMLRDLNRNKAASSELINSLKQEDYVNRFNEIGQKAAEFIGSSLNVSYDKTSSYGGFNTDVVEKVKKAASAAKSAISDLMDKVNYIKTGKSGYYSSDRPSGTDVESWIQHEMEKTDRALSAFEAAVTKAEDMAESVKASGNVIKEAIEDFPDYEFTDSYYVVNADDFQTLVDTTGGVFEKGYIEITKDEFVELANKHDFFTESEEVEGESLNETEYTPNARKCIDAANLLGQIDLKDIEDAAKIKDQVEKLFDKLVKLAPKLNKKEQKEIEEASKCDEEDSESLKAGKANMEKLRKQNGFTKSDEFVDGEAQAELEKKADDVRKAFAKSKEVKESATRKRLPVKDSK